MQFLPMASGRVLILFMIAVFFRWPVLQGCPSILNRPCCRQASSLNFSDTAVHPVSAGSCVFNNTLCHYTQGCVDPSMSTWSRQNGYALAYKTVEGFREDQTVLVSPLLDFRQDTCFQASYWIQPFKSGDMDGFFEYNPSSDDVVQLIQRKTQYNDPFFHVQITVKRSMRSPFGRVKIRAKSGIANQQVRLFSVFITEGRCETPGCDFNTGFCGWNNSGWETSLQLGSGTSAVLGDANSYHDGFVQLQAADGSLTSPLTRAPSSSSPRTHSSSSPISLPSSSSSALMTDCVRFRYLLDGQGERRLSVSTVEGLSDHGALNVRWTVRANTSLGSSPGWQDGAFPITGSRAYRIVFNGHQPASGPSVVAIHRLTVTPYPPHAVCSFQPPEAKTSAQPTSTTPRTSLTSKLQTAYPVTPGSVTPGPVTPGPVTPGSVTSGSMTTVHAGTGVGVVTKRQPSVSTDSSWKVGVIAGAAVGVFVAATGAVILGLFCYRQRKNRRQAKPPRPDNSNNSPRAETNLSIHDNLEITEHDPYDCITPPSLYDRPGDLIPNPYSRLHEAQHHGVIVSASATPASPYPDVTEREAASYVNMADREQSAARPYQNIEADRGQSAARPYQNIEADRGQSAARPYQNIGYPATSVPDSGDKNVYLEMM